MLLECDPNWSILKTDYFILKIQNRPEVWDFLYEYYSPVSKDSDLLITQKGEIQPQVNDTKVDVTPSE